jgi:capsule biosynthesis phosphatase
LDSIVFDLDGTICFPNLTEDDTQRRYADAVPNMAIVKSMRLLRRRGFKIVVCTARRMLTHEGSVLDVLEDVGAITHDWLNRHRVPFDELVFGKPHSTTWYVDDKAKTPEEFLEWVRDYK